MITSTGKIEKTKREDIDFACYLFEEAINYQKRKGYPEYKAADRKTLEEDIEKGQHYKLLLDDNIACMFCITKSDKAIWQELDRTAIYLHRVTVNPKYKGQKLFGKILHWLNGFAKQKGLKEIRLDTWADNPDLVNYYISFGFEVLKYFQIPDTPETSINCRGNKVVLMELKIT